MWTREPWPGGAGGERENRPGAVRIVATTLVDEELAEHGLRIETSSVVALNFAEGRDRHTGFRTSEDWLVPHGRLDVAHYAVAEWLPSVHERLDALRGAALDEDIVFSEPSATAALAFLHGETGWKRPGVFLLPNGNVRLLWTTAAGEQVGLEFRDRDEVQFVLFVAYEDRLLPQSGRVPSIGIRRVIGGAGLFRIMRA